MSHAFRRIHTLTQQCSPFRPLPTDIHHQEDKRISCQHAESSSSLYIPLSTTEGTMCLRWQVAIVHNVLMLTKCQFDPWDRWVGRGCGSWILKQATTRRSCGDGQRHDTDETSDYLPNGRHMQGKKGRKERWRGTKAAGRTDEQLSITLERKHKSYRSKLFLLICLEQKYGEINGQVWNQIWVIGAPRFQFYMLVVLSCLLSQARKSRSNLLFMLRRNKTCKCFQAVLIICNSWFSLFL